MEQASGRRPPPVERNLKSTGPGMSPFRSRPRRIPFAGLLSETEEKEHGGPNPRNGCPLARERVAHTWGVGID